MSLQEYVIIEEYQLFLTFNLHNYAKHLLMMITLSWLLWLVMTERSIVLEREVPCHITE